MRISVIGTGYVGLVAGACLADHGNDVVCLDIDADKVERLKQGEIPIYEPGLEGIVRRNAAAGRLRFTTDPEEATRHGVAQFIAVATPPDEDGSADLRYVLEAARNIGRYMTDYRLVIDKSTVPVGTAAKVKRVIGEELARRSVKIDYGVASNPEFLKEGAAVEDFMRPDRVVVGVDDTHAEQLLREIYNPILRNRDRILVMDVRSAELAKYAANAMLATRISFMNELANLAEKLGADIEDVRKGIGSDRRIGFDFLYAGCGYGGSCFPKDIKALVRTAREQGLGLTILNAVEHVNELQKVKLLDKITTRFGENLAGMRFAVWGLSFKPNTDDMREAPSRSIIKGLLGQGATVCAYDPAAVDEAKRVFGDETGIDYSATAMAALDGADALVIVTEWKEFRSPDFERIRDTLKRQVVFDGRNLYEPEVLQRYGLEYYPVGRPAVRARPEPARSHLVTATI
ncbi:MAG: UDP-glucose dehydrogenase family protein [Pseudomonadota bacterium]